MPGSIRLDISASCKAGLFPNFDGPIKGRGRKDGAELWVGPAQSRDSSIVCLYKKENAVNTSYSRMS